MMYLALRQINLTMNFNEFCYVTQMQVTNICHIMHMITISQTLDKRIEQVRTPGAYNIYSRAGQYQTLLRALTQKALVTYGCIIVQVFKNKVPLKGTILAKINKNNFPTYAIGEATIYNVIFHIKVSI